MAYTLLQRKSATKQTSVRGNAAARSLETVPGIVQRVASTPGESLPSAQRAHLDTAFGFDFRNVRIHSDERAGESAEALGARAYTFGRHVVFGRGENLNADGGRLLAHELAHVVQQNRAPSLQRWGIRQPDDAAEREADAAAESIVTNRGPGRVAPLTAQPSSIALAPKKKRTGKKRSKRRKRRKEPIDARELARIPAEALEKWRRLEGTEKFAVMVEMANRYGEKFTSEFLAEAKKKKHKHIENHHFSRSVAIDLKMTAGSLTARGYRLARVDLLNEWWVDPKGRIITIAVEDSSTATTVSPDETAALDEARTYAEEYAADKAELMRFAAELIELAEAVGSSSDEYIERYGEFTEAIDEFNALYGFVIASRLSELGQNVETQSGAAQFGGYVNQLDDFKTFQPYGEVVPGLPDIEPMDFSGE